MPLKPVEKVLVSDGILEQLRELITSGELSPGQRLPPELEMANQLSVSRASLREALNALVHLGYLDRRQKRVYVASETQWRTMLVFPLTRSPEELSIAEMIEVRKMVEPQLAALAAKRAQPEDLQSLEECLETMKARADNSEAFIASDYQFHLCIAKAAKNSLMASFVEKVQDVLRHNIALVVRKSPISKRSLRFHEEIVKAIKGGDASRSRRIMEAHIKNIEREFIKILYRRSGSSESEEIHAAK
jgi:GntR family transcriptional repressor for pyruvate dehydrogenase complex